MLAELVKQGKLPPVTERVPKEPLVVKPVHEIGQYGGTWRRGFTGPGDGENGNRIVSADKLLFWDYTGTQVRPCVARQWLLSDDGQVGHALPPQGHKWSDGKPFTADDFVFWYEDIYLNKDLVPTPHPDFTDQRQVRGRSRRSTRRRSSSSSRSRTTSSSTSSPGSTAMGGGQALWQMAGRTMGAYMPAHYVKQFHPKYIGKDAANAKAKAANFDGWVAYIKNRWDWRLNPELPVLTPWKTVTPINNPTWVLERNPFFYEVDTAGNQLPYIDRIQMTLAENLEVLNLRAIAGQYDLQERHTAMAKLPVFLENRDKVGYDVAPRPGAQRLRRHAPDQPRLRGRPRGREVAPHRRLPPGALDGHRPRPAQRDVLARDRHAGLHRAGRVHALQPRPGVAEEVVDARRQAGQRAARQDRAREEGRRGVPAADRRQGAAAHRAHDLGGRLHPAHSGRRDDQGAVEEDRHPGRRQGAGAEPVLHPSPSERAPDRDLGQRRHRAALPLPAPRPAGRSARVAPRHAHRRLVCLGRQAGQGARTIRRS